MTHITISGTVVRLQWVTGLVDDDNQPCWGTIQKDPLVRDPVLCLDDELRGLELVNTFIHEIIHRSQPSLCEEAVTQMADDITLGLAALGVLHNPNGVCKAYLTRE